MLRRRFEEMTAAELADAAPLDGAVAVIPIAATEQHGAHLPLGTDAIIADFMTDRVIAALGPDRPVTFLQTLRIGKSNEHARFPGTLSYDWSTATRALIAAGEGLAAAGFRRLVIVSSHGGNTPVMDTAALELRAARGVLCVTASWNRFGVPAGLLPEEEVAAGIHGGAAETSLMLAVRPDLVRPEHLADRPSLQAELAASARHLRAHGRLGFAWLAGDLNPSGTVGDARLASAAIGEAIAAHQAQGFAELLDDVLAFDLARLA